MKKTYPKYAQGDMNILEKKLNKVNDAVFKKFMIHVSATTGKLKQKDRRKDLLQIHDIIGKDFDKWTYEDVVGFLSVLNGSDRSPWTQKGTLTTLGVFLKWKFTDWSKRFKNLDILKKVYRRQQPDNSKKYNKNTLPTPEEIDIMIRTAKTSRDKCWISMASEAGLPPAVQINLKWEDLEFDTPEDGFTTLTYFRGKNKSKFIFPLKTSTYYLKQWKQEYCFPNLTKEDWVFPSPNNRAKPITKNSMYYMLNHTAKKANIVKFKDSSCYQYLFRHKTLSDGYEDMPEEVHRKIYGHVSGSKQTKTYSHQTDDAKTLRKALELLHKVKPLNKEEINKIAKLELEIQTLKSRHDLLLKRFEEFLNEIAVPYSKVVK